LIYSYWRSEDPRAPTVILSGDYRIQEVSEHTSIGSTTQYYSIQHVL
jgi:hypothetical protein